MMAKRIGLSACVLAVLMLGAALVTGGMAGVSGPSRGGPRVIEAWVRPAIVPGRPAAGFLTIIGGATSDRLLGVSSPQAARIELHESRMDDGVMRMTALRSIGVPAHGQVIFAPEGRHLMLFGLPASLQPGDRLVLNLRFATAGLVQTTAAVRSGQDEGHAHHH